MDRGAWWATVHGVTGVGQDLVTKQQHLFINHLLLSIQGASGLELKATWTQSELKDSCFHINPFSIPVANGLMLFSLILLYAHMYTCMYNVAVKSDDNTLP